MSARGTNYRYRLHCPYIDRTPIPPLVDILPGQLYAYHLTRARGLDPDRPRTISKVTETT